MSGRPAPSHWGLSTQPLSWPKAALILLGHTQPPSGHWLAPFWESAHADARVLAKVLQALAAAAKSLRTVASSTKDTEFLGTACEVRAYAGSRASSAEHAMINRQGKGNDRWKHAIIP